MNRPLLMFAALMLYAFSQVQAVDDAQKTKLEKFQSQTGTVIIKGYTKIGNLRGGGVFSLSALEISHLGNEQKQSGVVIKIVKHGRNASSFIDYDEIDSLLKGIDYMIEATASVSKLDNFELTYCSKGNFKIVASRNTQGEFEAAVSSGYDNSVTFDASLENIADLKKLIISAKQTLEAAK